MPKGTTCRDAIAGFEGVKGVVAANSEKVSLASHHNNRAHKHAAPLPLSVSGWTIKRQGSLLRLLVQVDLAGVNPPIEKMDAALGSLKACRCAQ